VLRNAAVPIIRNIPATLLLAIIGSYYVETIWGIPGTGNLLIGALRSSKPDVPVIQGLTVIYAALSMSAFLLGDIVTIFFDPRIKLTSK
jgi:oligopeptide transport system permease protein